MTDKGSIALALSTAAIVPSIYGVVMPSMADARAQSDDHGHLARCEQYAAIIAGAVVLGVAGAARSPEAGLAGLVAVVAFAAAYHHSVNAQP